jgi:hypothetical protein
MAGYSLAHSTADLAPDPSWLSLLGLEYILAELTTTVTMERIEGADADAWPGILSLTRPPTWRRTSVCLLRL